MSLTERWDGYATHPVWGFLIMLGMVAVGLFIAKLTGMKITWISVDLFLPAIKEAARSALDGFSPWFVSMVADGIISGLGILTIFTVFLTMFFILLGILEDVGYMARVGFLMHRFMRRIGLHGKSFFPLGVGFACNVPGVMGTRVAESERARMMTILLTPFVPCIAQTAVTVFLAPIFFGAIAPLVVGALILMDMAVLTVTGMILNKGLPKRERLGLVMELPLYHWPNPRTIGIYVWHQMKHFLKRAGTVIFSVTVIIWALGYFPNGEMESSFLASIGRMLVPLGDLMGLSWKMLVALFASFIAKETALATMGVLLGGGDLAANLQATVTPAAGLGFLVTHMLFIPCIATLSVIVSEARSWKWTCTVVTYLFVVAFGLGILTYQVARWII
jgi:ferrous iron transport protein B